MYYTYILQSEKDKKIYIGHTKNVNKRLNEHNSGQVKSTRNRRPFQIIYTEEYATKKEASWREYSLKKSAHQRQQILKNIIPR